MDLHHSTDICYVTLLFSLCICVCVFVFVYLCLCNCIFILRLVHFASRWNGGAAPLDCHGRVNQHLLQAALFFLNIISANTTCIPPQKIRIQWLFEPTLGQHIGITFWCRD